MEFFLVIGTLFFCFAVGVPIAYSLGLAAIAGAISIGIPLEAVMLKISDGVSKVAMLTIVLTFFGAAACYRTSTHMGVSVFVRMLSGRWKAGTLLLSEGLVAALSVFMVVYGEGLCAATWYQSIADFPSLSVGVTYLPIPVGGAVTLLFVLERVLLGRPPPAAFPGAEFFGRPAPEAPPGTAAHH